MAISANAQARRRGQRPPNGATAERLARGLGWFSIGLGLTEIVAPRRFATIIGIENQPRSRRAIVGLGVREVVSGAGILARPRSANWLWARVGGDAMDLALLASALGSKRVRRGQLAAATAAVAGVTLLDVLAGRQAEHNADAITGKATRAIGGIGAITINKSPDELYRFWRNVENLPQCMSHLESVRVIDDQRSHWTARGPADVRIEWEAEITDDRPNELIAWQSISGADVPNAGSVRFYRAPGDRGTEVRVALRYELPGADLSALVAKLFGKEPQQQVKSDLRRLKQVMETGEVIRSDASIHRGPYPAQPSPGRTQSNLRSRRKGMR